MAALCRKTTHFHRDEQKKAATSHQHKLNDDFNAQPAPFSHWHHCEYAPLPPLLRARWQMLGWELPGTKGWAPTNPFSLPSCTLQGAHRGLGKRVRDWMLCVVMPLIYTWNTSIPPPAFLFPSLHTLSTQGEEEKVEGDLRQRSSAGRGAAKGRQGAYGELRTP